MSCLLRLCWYVEKPSMQPSEAVVGADIDCAIVDEEKLEHRTVGGYDVTAASRNEV